MHANIGREIKLPSTDHQLLGVLRTRAEKCLVRLARRVNGNTGADANGRTRRAGGAGGRAIRGRNTVHVGGRGDLQRAGNRDQHVIRHRGDGRARRCTHRNGGGNRDLALRRGRRMLARCVGGNLLALLAAVTDAIGAGARRSSRDVLRDLGINIGRFSSPLLGGGLATHRRGRGRDSAERGVAGIEGQITRRQNEIARRGRDGLIRHQGQRERGTYSGRPAGGGRCRAGGRGVHLHGLHHNGATGGCRTGLGAEIRLNTVCGVGQREDRGDGHPPSGTGGGLSIQGVGS